MSTTPPPTDQDHPATAAEPGPDAWAGPRATAADARALGRLRRSRDDRKVAGLSGGLGRHLDVDPTIIRVAFVALTLFGGAGVLLYAAGWLLVPEEGSDRGRVDLDPGVRTVVLVVAGVLTVAALLGTGWGWGWGGFGFPLPVAVAGLVVVAVIAGRQSRAAQRPPVGPGPVGGPVAGPVVGPVAGPVSLDKDAPTAPALWTPTAGPAVAPGGAPGSTSGWVGAPPPAPPTWAAPPWPPSPPAPPRRRGPSLFLPTLALVVLGWGVLWAVDLGRDLPATAYAALALAVSGAMLVVSAWFGRGGGVVLVGLLAALGLAVTAVAQSGVGDREVRPTTAAELSSGYRLGVGQLVVDLAQVTDPQALDNRTLRLDADLGQIVVDVPSEVTVVATATADGGRVDVFGRTAEGDSPAVTETHDAGPDAPRLTIEAEVDYGQITVRSN